MTDTQLVTSNDASNLATSAKRTGVPLGLAVIVADVVDHFHWNITPVELTAIGTAAGYVYWFGVRLIEHVSDNPKWGWLLGSPKAPVYPTGSQTPIDPAGK